MSQPLPYFLPQDFDAALANRELVERVERVSLWLELAPWARVAIGVAVGMAVLVVGGLL